MALAAPVLLAATLVQATTETAKVDLETSRFMVDVSGDTFVVGTTVFERIGGVWTQVQTLTPSGGVSGENFGADVAVHSDIIAVGTPSTDGGAVYVFERTPNGWEQHARLTSPAEVNVGRSVDTDGRRIAAGGYAPDTGKTSIEVFIRQGASWAHEVSLTAPAGLRPPGVPLPSMGYNVAVDGDTVLTGAPFAHLTPPACTPGSCNTVGEAYVFSNVGGLWSLTRIANPEPRDFDRFGESVALDGTTALIGAPNDSPPGTGNSRFGSAYVFTGGGGAWSLSAILNPPDRGPPGPGTPCCWYFGTTVSLHGSAAFVGARYSKGRVYLFAGSGGSWVSIDTYTTSDSAQIAAFSEGVAGGGGIIVASSSSSQAAYVFSYELPGSSCDDTQDDVIESVRQISEDAASAADEAVCGGG